MTKKEGQQTDEGAELADLERDLSGEPPETAEPGQDDSARNTEGSQPAEPPDPTPSGAEAGSEGKDGEGGQEPAKGAEGGEGGEVRDDELRTTGDGKTLWRGREYNDEELLREPGVLKAIVTTAEQAKAQQRAAQAAKAEEERVKTENEALQRRLDEIEARIAGKGEGRTGEERRLPTRAELRAAHMPDVMRISDNPGELGEDWQGFARDYPDKLADELAFAAGTARDLTNLDERLAKLESLLGGLEEEAVSSTKHQRAVEFTRGVHANLDALAADDPDWFGQLADPEVRQVFLEFVANRGTKPEGIITKEGLAGEFEAFLSVRAPGIVQARRRLLARATTQGADSRLAAGERQGARGGPAADPMLELEQEMEG